MKSERQCQDYAAAALGESQCGNCWCGPGSRVWRYCRWHFCLVDACLSATSRSASIMQSAQGRYRRPTREGKTATKHAYFAHSAGQTRERIPSNAWARKIAAPTKPITAVIVSNIANVLNATARQKTAATLHSQKDFRAPTHNPDRPTILRNRRASTCDPAPIAQPTPKGEKPVAKACLFCNWPLQSRLTKQHLLLRIGSFHYSVCLVRLSPDSRRILLDIKTTRWARHNGTRSTM